MQLTKREFFELADNGPLGCMLVVGANSRKWDNLQGDKCAVRCAEGVVRYCLAYHLSKLTLLSKAVYLGSERILSSSGLTLSQWRARIRGAYRICTLRVVIHPLHLGPPFGAG